MVRGFGHIGDVVVQQTVGDLELTPAAILQPVDPGRTARPYPPAGVHPEPQNRPFAVPGDLDALESPPARAPGSHVQARAGTGPDPPLGIGGQTANPLIQQPREGTIKLGGSDRKSTRLN